MTDLTTIRPTSETVVDASPTPAPVTTPTQEPVLITEQQVLFSTAAVALPPAKTRRWTDTIGSVAAAVGAWFVEAANPPRPRYTKRYDFLEHARMSREMDRL
jgi:hypothetical protein